MNYNVLAYRVFAIFNLHEMCIRSVVMIINAAWVYTNAHFGKKGRMEREEM